MKAKRVVLDTNVLISAALRPNGSPRAVVDAVQAESGVEMMEAGGMGHRNCLWFRLSC